MTNKNELKKIEEAKQVWSDLLAKKNNTTIFLKILIDIYEHLGVIRSAELMNMKVYYDSSAVSNKCKDYIDLSLNVMVVNIGNGNKTSTLKNLDISVLDTNLIRQHRNNGDYLFPQSNGLPYSTSTGFNKNIKTNLDTDFSLLRYIKVSLVMCDGTEEDKMKLSHIHGTSLQTMSKEYQKFVKLI